MIRVIELFGGMGAVHTALDRLNIDYQLVDMVEFDKKVVEAYNLIHNTNFQPQDILTWNKDIKCDYLHASTPCQCFSIAGKQLGASDSRGAPLWEATLRVIKQTEPKIITLENVKGLLSDKHKELVNWYISELDKLGYQTTYQVLNAKNFGAPQNRERVFFISWKKDLNIDFMNLFNFKQYIPKCIKDILDNEATWLTPKEVIFLDKNTLIFKNEMRQYNGHIVKVNLLKAQESGNRIIKCAEIQRQKWDGTIGNCYDCRTRVYSDKGIFHACDCTSANNVIQLEPAQSHIGKDIFNICQNTMANMNGHFLQLEKIPFDSDSKFFNKEGQSPTLLSTACDFKNKLCDIDFQQMKSFNNDNGITGTLRAGDCNVNEKIIDLSTQPFTIKYRTLTPRECFRLMDFSDEQFDKVKHFSTSRLTKLAGNSIVVECIRSILENIFTKLKIII